MASADAGGSVVLHWNGTALSRVDGPKCDYPYRVWVGAPNDVWLTGAPGSHFDGQRWIAIQPGGDNAVLAIGGRGRDDVWLVTSGEWSLHA